VSERENHVLPPGTNDSWLTWLMTGVRRAPVDRRRVRGAHKGLKQMLVVGMAVSAEHPYSWKEFSDAMVRQSVGEAVRSLPQPDAQVVKLAYFGGLSNQEIADRLGLSVAAVERRLRDAIARISRHVEHGKALGRRAIGALVVWLSARWLGDAAHHAAQVGALAAVVVMIAAQPLPAGPSSHAAPAQPAPYFGTSLGTAGSVKAPSSAPAAGAPQAPGPAAAIPTAQAPVVSLPAIPSVSLPQLPKELPTVRTPVQLPSRA